MAVSKRLRFEIFRRDGFKCRYCGLVADETELTIDHVVPRALGGSDEPTNLVTACKDCNAGKTSSNPDAPLVADVDQRAVEWAYAMEQAMAQRMAAFAVDRARTDAFDKAWIGWGDARRPAGWRSSVIQFLAFGLTDEYLMHAVDTAMGNQRIRTTDVWKYFCGICWTEIRKAQESIRPGADQDPTEASVPRLQSLTEPFDYMVMFDDFVELLLEAMGGDERLYKFVNRHLWSAMPVAHSAWFDQMSEESPVLDDEESLEEVATNVGRDAMREYLSDPMCHVADWHSIVYGPTRTPSYEAGQVHRGEK